MTRFELPVIGADASIANRKYWAWEVLNTLEAWLPESGWDSSRSSKTSVVTQLNLMIGEDLRLNPEDLVKMVMRLQDEVVKAVEDRLRIDYDRLRADAARASQVDADWLAAALLQIELNN